MGVTPDRRELLDDCVHCGFCLPACPTYRLWGREEDSPRGRIALMAQTDRGDGVTPSVVRHIDACLGCMACVPACPSGVRYGELIEGMRGEVESQHRRSWLDRSWRRLLFAVLPFPSRLAWMRRALFVYQRLGLRWLLRRTGVTRMLPRRLAALERLQPEVRKMAIVPDAAGNEAASRATVALHLGCVQRVFFSSVNAAISRVLAAEGCRVVVAGDAGCCGGLSLHAGRREEAGECAATLTAACSARSFDYLVTGAAGCGSALKDYDRVLARPEPAPETPASGLAARTRDVSELLWELGSRAPRNPLPTSAAYHEACHLAHAQGVREAPRALLESIPELDVRYPREIDLCCGSAGIYNLVEPEAAEALGARKARAIADTAASLLVTTNPGCALQIASQLELLGHPLPVRHVVEVVDASIRGLTVEQLVSDRG